MPLISDIQVLEPGSEVLLFELDGTDYGADVLRFHGHAIPHTAAELIAAGDNADQLPAKAIYWQRSSRRVTKPSDFAAISRAPSR